MIDGEGRGARAGVWTQGQAAVWERMRKPRAKTGSAPDTDAHAHTSSRTGTARGSGEFRGAARAEVGPGLGLMQGARSGLQSQRLAQSAALWEAGQ